MEKKTSTGKDKVIIGVTGFLLGAVGITVWNNREKIKDTATSAKERAIELKTKTTEIADTVKAKLMALKNVQELNTGTKSDKTNLEEEKPFQLYEDSSLYTPIDFEVDNQEDMELYFDKLHKFLDELQKKIDEEQH